MTYSGRPRRRRGWIALLIIVVVLGGAVAIADRWAADYGASLVRRQLAAQAESRGVSFESATVHIGGFPFLTQVIGGRYDEISIDLTNVRSADVTLPHMRVDAVGVTADATSVMDNSGSAVAERITGTAVISFETLAKMAEYQQLDLSQMRFSQADGVLLVNAIARVGTIAVPVGAKADIAVVNQVPQIKLRDITVVGVDVSAYAADYLNDLAGRSVTAQMPTLPFGLVLDRVQVDPDGLRVTATAREVPLVA